MSIPEPVSGYPYNRLIAEGSEQVAVALWRLTFDRVAEAKDKLEGVYVQVVDDRSSLRLDDRYLGTWRTGSLHVTAMQASVDALMTVRTILQPVSTGDNLLPMSGLYPIIRASLESSALAIYLLESIDRDERLRRSYVVAEEDAKYLQSFAESMGNSANDARARARAEIRELIASRPTLGDPAQFRFEGVKYSELIENADAVMAADPATPGVERMTLIAWWKLLSGLSHGKQWAFVESMERSDAIIDEANESAHVRQSSSAAAVAVVFQLAVETLEAALRLYGRRSKVTWAQPEDAAEPPTITFTELHGRAISPPDASADQADEPPRR